jgi:fatty-acyl-CoA synthase
MRDVDIGERIVDDHFEARARRGPLQGASREKRGHRTLKPAKVENVAYLLHCLGPQNPFYPFARQTIRPLTLIASLKREAIYINAIARTLRAMRAVTPDATRTIADIIEEFARDKPHNIAVLYQDQVITYRALNEGANRYAHWARGLGIRRGDVAALLMENRPEFLMAWLGLIKLGGVVALINTNLRGAPLAHSFAVTSPKLAIVGAELAQPYRDAEPLLEAKPLPWSAGARVAGYEDLDAALAAQPTTNPDMAWRDGLTLKDRAFYIYTSGTTGLPKAANISHMRMFFMMVGFSGALGAKESDRIYDVLPLYHSAGGIAALGPAFLNGGSVVIRRKFSVQEFWEYCFHYKPTFFQYIGELCRYLLNAPPGAHERDHQLRAIIGNGLRPEIWARFQERFAIPKIVEFYGATEGNVSFLNYDGNAGAVGRLPGYMKRIVKSRIVRFDVAREMPVRGADGFCIECADDEVGEGLGQIHEEAGRNFEGYTRAADTQKKILRDVFEKGDSWFRTGDLLRRDKHGYIYFVDRIGDTFRWKGENVATSEVAEALGVVPGVKEANVYGVAIPGMDGRAGMAALVTDNAFDVRSLATDLARNLASYARPVFIRLQPEIEITGTFKQRKVDLVAEGFDPERIAVPLYWLNPASGTYEPLDADAYRAIVSGAVRF